MIRETTLVLGLAAGIWANAVRAKGVSYSGKLSPSGSDADGQLFVTGPEWDSSYADTTLGWVVDNTTTPGKWRYVYMLTVSGGTRRSDIQCVIVETADGSGGQAFTAGNLFSPASTPADRLVTTQIAFLPAGSQRNLPRDMYGVEFCTLAKDPTTLTVSFDSDRGPRWGDLYVRSFTICDVSNVLYNAGMLSLNPPDAPHGGSVNSHVLVPEAAVNRFFVPVPAGVFLGAVGVFFTGWLQRHRWL